MMDGRSEFSNLKVRKCCFDNPWGGNSDLTLTFWSIGNYNKYTFVHNPFIKWKIKKDIAKL